MGTRRGESPHGTTYDMRTYRKNRKADLWRRVLEGYGSRCACCGETEPKFLTLDHVKRDGKAHRQALGRNFPTMFYGIIRAGFPPRFRILCWNCHMAKDIRGGCPHKRRVYGRRIVTTS